ncbi:MAG TPA: TAXI family TRAP transporter solute-binding subunit [Clostridia bacterium]|nr:TAXI family TRAP transporter solute-binding subunit [Clostridia bacterium]
MFSRKKFYLLLAMVLMGFVLVISGCGNKSAPEPSAGETDQEVAESDWPESLTIGSASIGGVYYVYAGGWAQIIEKELGIPIGVEVTGGPNHNMQLVQSGDLELGMVTMGPAWEAWNGEGDWTGGGEHKDVRAIFPMYNTYSQWWAVKNSGINSIFDLEGKTLGVGPAGGTSGTYHPRILDLLGIKATTRLAGLSDLVTQHIDGQLDANSFASGVPVAGVLETAAQRDIVLFGVDGEARDKVIAEWPYWSAATIPAEAYDFLDEDVETIGIWNMAIARKDLPEDLVYAIVKAVHDNQADLIITHKTAEETVPENVVHNTWLWMHPGAIRYYEEIGITLPEGVYPPEYKK